MGNRAVITTRKEWERDGIGIYLHWNGGMDSVSAFLRYCKLKGYRAPDCDCYGWARLCQVIGNFFGGSESIGIDKLWYLDKDNGDNGVYLIEGWEVKERYYHDGPEQEGYEMKKMLKAINDSMPEGERLPEDFILGDPTKTEDIKVGDIVYTQSFNGDVWSAEVIGIGEDEYVNGTNVKGIPYVNAFGQGDLFKKNINNYLRKAEYIIKK